MDEEIEISNFDSRKLPIVKSSTTNASGINTILRRKGFQRRDTRTSFMVHQTEKALNQFIKIQKSVHIPIEKSPRVKEPIQIKQKEEISSMSSKNTYHWREDLSKNLSNIMKPSHPDFGYQECMNFSDEEDNQKYKSKWAIFLELIQRYPLKQQVQNVVIEIKKEKELLNLK